MHLRDPGGRATAGRAAQLAGSVARHLARPLAARGLNRRGSPRPAAATLARPIRRLCEDMGATFLKYGQLVASAESLFGPELAGELRATLDAGPPVPAAEVRARIERDLGRPLREVFAHLDPEPLGCASLAVVHRAVTVDGRDVAVKVLRPGIRATAAADLQLMGTLLPPIARRTGVPLDMVVRSLRSQLSEELDLRNEARTMAYFRALAAGHSQGLDRVHVPEPYPELSGPGVLTMEFLDGVAVDDEAGIAAMGIDPRPAVEQVVKAWFLTALEGGVFHGDVHAGNVMVLRDGRIGLLDWGIVGRLAPRDHHFFCQTIRGALGDPEAIEEVVEDQLATWLPVITARADVDPALVKQFMVDTFGVALRQPFGEVSLADMISGPQQEMTRLADESGSEIRSRRQQRRALRDQGFEFPEMDRSVILLAKQLAYFERIGKLHLADIPILHDEAFFASVLGYERPEADPIAPT